MATTTEHEVWQVLHPPGTFGQGGPHARTYPAALDDGRQILLPIRPLADGRHALASLIVNQASFAVQDALADDLAGRLAPFAPDLVVGLPTLGLTLAAAVARRLGHRRYVPLGTSPKFWYSEEMSVPLASVTTPAGSKRLYIDPRMLDLVATARVALVDDVISSGASILSGLRLMGMIDVTPVVVGAAMLQSDRWRAALEAEAATRPPSIARVFETPLLSSAGDGWWRPA